MNAMAIVTQRVHALASRLRRDEAGQDLIEYALLAGLISLVAVLAITALGTGISGLFDQVLAKLPKP